MTITVEREQLLMKIYNRAVRGDVTELISSLDSYGHIATVIAEHHHDHFRARLQWAHHDEDEADTIVSYQNENGTLYGFSDQAHVVSSLEKTYAEQPVSWFAVSEDLFDHLQSNDELVVNTGALCLWGRYTFGQLVIVDHVFKTFTDECVNKGLAS